MAQRALRVARASARNPESNVSAAEAAGALPWTRAAGRSTARGARTEKSLDPPEAGRGLSAEGCATGSV